tara:strand:- start:5933 stop:6295 length:363 start_codon:yes stop_codon:yes gene_type:complete
MGRFRKFNIKKDFTMSEPLEIKNENEKLKKVLQKVRAWLQDELKMQTEANDVLDKIAMNKLQEYEPTQDDSIAYGRWECAQGLLSYLDNTEEKILHGVGENFEGETFNRVFGNGEDKTNE